MIELAASILILAGSLALLAASSHFTVGSLEKLMALTGLSEVSAGFVILAVMTSTSEIIVAIFSVLQGSPGITVGDVLGSNVFNLGAVIGILGMLGYLKMCCTTLWMELTDILFVTSLIPLLLVISHYHIFEVSSPIVGAILLAIFVANTYFISKRGSPAAGEETPVPRTREKPGIGRVVAELLVSFVGVVVAARLVVSYGLSIADLLDVPPILIGAKLVSIGTSLPELTVGFAAVRRGRVHLAIGNIIGSNLTNLTLVLGLVLLVSPFAVDMVIFTEMLPFLLITTIIFWRFLTKGGISQVGGIVLMMVYILFQAVIV